MTTRDTFKYHIKQGNTILHRGVTNNLGRRHSEHKRTYGTEVKIVQIGRKVVRNSALQWERDGGRKIRC